MKKVLLLVAMMLTFGNLFSQQTKPKVVIGIVVDQMRWDYLYKFSTQYTSTGFNRLKAKGFMCQNTHVNYLPSLTAPGHTGIYTGSIPSIHGITGNSFVLNSDVTTHEATEDLTVNTIGIDKKGSSSPVNMNTSTVTDELRLATNYKSRVFSVSLKDRGSVFPGGHLANASYWYNSKVGFTTSTYYMDKLPDWLVKFNNKHYQDSLARYGWNMGKYDYSLSTEDNSPYEDCFPNEKEPTFPHLSGKDMGEGFEMTPLANTYLCSMVRSLIEGENIGGTGNTDFLAISFSSPDILGHKFGINGIEMQDMFLSLDKDISLLLLYLDKKYGENGYLLFLTADHGGSHNANYLKDKKVPAGVFPKTVVPELNAYLKGAYGVDSIVATFTNYYQFYFNNKAFLNGLSREAVRSTVVDWLQKRPEVLYAYDLNKISSSNLPERIKQMAINGYYSKRGGDVQALLNTAWYEYAGKEKGNTHGTFSPADTHIPLIFYGWNVKPGETTVEYHTTDIAPTISSMLHIQMPNGSIGTPVQFK